jgi:hypothetical protein
MPATDAIDPNRRTSACKPTPTRITGWPTQENLKHERQYRLDTTAVGMRGRRPEDALVLLADFHLFLQDGNPVLIRAIKDALVAGKARGRVLFVLGCRQVLPPELEREFVLLDFGLPGKDPLGQVPDGNLAAPGG